MKNGLFKSPRVLLAAVLLTAALLAAVLMLTRGGNTDIGGTVSSGAESSSAVRRTDGAIPYSSTTEQSVVTTARSVVPGESVSNVSMPEKMRALVDASGTDYSLITASSLIIVKSSGSEAELFFYEKTNDSWSEALESCGAYVGSGGVGADKAEGDKKTPAGIFDAGFAFGREDNPGTQAQYRKITADSYWVDDADSAYYNTWVEGTDNKDWSSAEHLADYKGYDYAFVIDYNTDPVVRGRGSAIFFHCGTGPTNGCVAAARDTLVYILCHFLREDSTQIIIF